MLARKILKTNNFSMFMELLDAEITKRIEEFDYVVNIDGRINKNTVTLFFERKTGKQNAVFARILFNEDSITPDVITDGTIEFASTLPAILSDSIEACKNLQPKLYTELLSQSYDYDHGNFVKFSNDAYAASIVCRKLSSLSEIYISMLHAELGRNVRVIPSFKIEYLDTDSFENGKIIGSANVDPVWLNISSTEGEVRKELISAINKVNDAVKGILDK